MKTLKYVSLALALTLAGTGAFALPQDEAAQIRAEQDVKVTNGPTITNITGNSATIKWTTSSVAANHVRYRPVGGGQWKEAFNGQGSTNHEMQLTGLEPGKTYEYQILTRRKTMRLGGQFQTAATATGTMPDVHNTASASASTAASTNASDNSERVANADWSTPNGRVTVIRAVNPNNNAHTFVTSESQVPAGFKREGVAGYLVGKKVNDFTVPLYGMTHANGDFFYTTDDRERQSARASGYSDQGIVGYIAKNQQSGTVPMYRMIDRTGLQHFYTTSDEERRNAQPQGWRDEGITGYIWSK